MNGKNKKVLWLANIPSPYSVDFFNELGKLCDLTVLFERASADDRDKSWKDINFKSFQGIILKGLKYGADKALCPGICRYLCGRYDIVVVSNMATLSGMLAVAFLRLIGKEYLIQGDGGFHKDGIGLKEKTKKWIISGSSLCLSTGVAHDDYYQFYGAAKERLKRIPFSSLYEKDIDKAPALQEEKEMLKKKLGLSGERIVLSIGQFIYRKGFDLLIKAAASLPDNINVYIIGGTPTTEYFEIIEQNKIDNVFFVPFQKHDTLPDYFRAADVFVLPTREDIWGLVINEAMAHGLPIVTTERCVAGLELIENEKNGYIIPVDNVEKITEAIQVILAGDMYQIGLNNIQKMHEYSFEKIAEVHNHIFDEYVGEEI